LVFHYRDNTDLDVPKSTVPSLALYPSSADYMGSSPRLQVVYNAATSAIKEERDLRPKGSSTPSFQHFRQPMRLLMQIFHDLSDKNEDFWFKIAPLFTKENIPAGTVLWNQGVCAIL
jgi:sulfate permease, SulP family